MPDTRARLPVVYKPQKLADNDQFTPYTLWFLCAAVVLYVLYSYLHQHGMMSDEGFHRPFIDALVKREFDNLPDKVTTPPLFHGVIAFLTSISGVQGDTLKLMRVFQWLMCVGAIPIFYKIARQLGHPNSDIKTIVCLALPIYLPFWGLVYTDPPTITLIAGGFLLTLRRQHWLAALVLCLALGFRQLAIFWVGFCALFGLYSDYTELRFRKGLAVRPALIRAFFRSGLPYSLPVFLLVGYTVYTGGIVQGDKNAHQVSFNSSNVFTFLLVSFAVLFPYVVQQFQRVVHLFLRSKMIWVFSVALLIWYFATYEISHGYNHPSNSWWLHNQLLDLSTSTPIAKLLFFIPVLWMAVTFYSIALEDEDRWRLVLLYGIAVCSFVFLPLVEWRYYIPALLFFHMLSPVKSLMTDRFVAVMYVGLSFHIVYAHVERHFFL